jgi:hypothetical protein
MPPRSITLAIVAFWLAMTAWLLWRDVWPNLAPGEPPPFAIAHMDDNKSAQTPVTWLAEHISNKGAGDRRREYTITQTVEYDSRSDTFALKAAMRPKSSPLEELRAYRDPTLTSTYRVTRAGQMLDLDVAVNLPAGAINPTGNRDARFTGEVHGQACVLDWETGSGTRRRHGSESLEVSYNGVVLLPLHPLDRIRGLVPGRRWACNLLDPLESSALLSSGPKVVWVHAEVLPRTENRLWNAQAKDCLVIEYHDRGDDVRGRVWVEVKEDRVLRMEVRLGQEQWVITRSN